jgi:hypothetical protein
MDTESTKKHRKSRRKKEDSDRAEFRLMLDIAADIGALPEILHQQIREETKEYAAIEGLQIWATQEG